MHFITFASEQNHNVILKDDEELFNQKLSSDWRCAKYLKFSSFTNGTRSVEGETMQRRLERMALKEIENWIKLRWNFQSVKFVNSCNFLLDDFHSVKLIFINSFWFWYKCGYKPPKFLIELKAVCNVYKANQQFRN